MNESTQHHLRRVLRGEVALARSAALLATGLRSRRQRGVAQVVSETAASNTSVLVTHSPANSRQTLQRAGVKERWLARVLLGLGDRWAVRFLSLLLRRQQHRVREALALVDERAHRLLSQRLVPASRLSRMVLLDRHPAIGGRVAVPQVDS